MWQIIFIILITIFAVAFFLGRYIAKIINEKEEANENGTSYH